MPTIAPARPDIRTASRRRARALSSQDDYQRLPRVRRHTKRTLRSLRLATSAAERRGGHDAPPVPSELAAAVPRWSSRKHFLTVVRALSKQPYVAELCLRHGIGVETWLALITNDALDTDADGRNMRTSKCVAAARVGRGEEQVKRARRVAVQLGIMVEVFRGRELTKVERIELTSRQPGHRQRGLPSTYTMTICRPRQRRRITTPRPGEFAQVYPLFQANVPLPPEGGLSLLTHLLEQLPLTSADAAEEAEPPPAAQHRRRRWPGMTLAFEVLAHPGLAVLLAGVRPGTIAGQLVPHTAGGWHGHALAASLLAEADRLGIATRESARSPWALLKVLLSRIDPVADVHLGIGRAGPPEQLRPPHAARPEPCGGSTCDGFGWLNDVDERGCTYARPCPDCPPSVRATWVDQLTATTDSEEPPF